MPGANNTESDNGSAGEPQQQGSGNVNANENQNSNENSNGATGQRDDSASGQRAVPAASAQVSAGTPNFGEVLTAVQAMPEQIVRALKEATQPAQQPRNAQGSTDTGNQGNGAQTAAQTGSQGSSANGNREPGRKTFTEWWFGR